MREHPHISVFVHERGTPHMADPQKLIDSAARLYGNDMNRLWGEIAPVPAANLLTLSGGERIDAGGRSFEVAYTPGHASHHVSYLDRSSGVAFVGDVAGVRIDGGFVLPPTPPPDIDLEKWRGSLDAIERLVARHHLSHALGPASKTCGPPLETLWSNLQEMAGWDGRRVDDSLVSDEERSRTSRTAQGAHAEGDERGSDCRVSLAARSSSCGSDWPDIGGRRRVKSQIPNPKLQIPSESQPVPLGWVLGLGF